MPENLSVRLSRPHDFNELRMLDLKCYHYPFSEALWREISQKSGQKGESRCVVAVWHRQPIGFAVWTLVDDHVLILRLGVLPRYRRQKVGRLLEQTIYQHALNEGAREIKVVVPDVHCKPGDKDDVSVFLNKVGYNTTGEIIPNYKRMYGDLRDGYVFVRKI